MENELKFRSKRGASLIRLLFVASIVIALLVFFNASSLNDIKQLLGQLGQGVVTVFKDLWYQIIMPVVSFFLTVLGRVVQK